MKTAKKDNKILKKNKKIIDREYCQNVITGL